MHDGTTPLQLAVKAKQESIIARLVSAGADINVKTSHMSEESIDDDDADESKNVLTLKSFTCILSDFSFGW